MKIYGLTAGSFTFYFNDYIQRDRFLKQENKIGYFHCCLFEREVKNEEEKQDYISKNHIIEVPPYASSTKNIRFNRLNQCIEGEINV